MKKMRPCQKKGNHKIGSIKPLDVNDDSDKCLIKEGYNWVGICNLCKGRIIAKNKEEYNL